MAMESAAFLYFYCGYNLVACIKKKMNQSNKILLEENLKEHLKGATYSSNLDDYKYEIKLDLSDTKDLSSNIEQIMNFWVLPNNLNKKLYKKQVIDLLVTGTNEIPLWIGVKVEEKLIQLVISKRFKKLKVVKEWHNENNNIPFVKMENLKPIPNYYKEFCFLYPASMYDNQPLNSDEFWEIANVLNLGNIDLNDIEHRITKNGENKNAEILKINSTEFDDQYILIDLWNHDQINVMNIYCRSNGANNDFIYRSLYRWNQRLWKDLGPKIKEVESGQIQRLKDEGRIIEEYKN